MYTDKRIYKPPQRNSCQYVFGACMTCRTGCATEESISWTALLAPGVSLGMPNRLQV